MSTYKRTILLFTLMAIALLSACGLSAPDLPDAAQIGQTATTVAATAEAVMANAAASQLAEELPSGEEIANSFASALPEGSVPIDVTITDVQLNKLIAILQASTQQPANIDNLSASFSDGNVILSGTLNEPINGQITVTFHPNLVDNHVQFEVVSAAFGKINVPVTGLNVVQSALNKIWVGALNNLQATITIEEISVGDGMMTIVGDMER